MIAWHVVVAEQAMEGAVVDELSVRGIEAWCPIEHRWEGSARGRRRAARALFRRYLFARVDPADADQHQAVLHTEGVSGFLGLPRTVPARLIDELRALEAGGAFDHTRPGPEPDLSPGKRVKIVKGQFTGVLASIVQAPRNNRIRILMDALGRGTSKPSDIAADHVEPVDQSVAA
jgi:transcriptional antiterminator RfaH